MSRNVGALTIDNPNSPVDPTLILSNAEVKFLCSKCGNEMYRFNDKVGTSYSDAGPFLKLLFTQAEINQHISNRQNSGGCGCVGAIVCLFAAIAMFGSQDPSTASLRTFAFLAFLAVGLASALVALSDMSASTTETAKLTSVSIKTPTGSVFTFTSENIPVSPLLDHPDLNRPPVPTPESIGRAALESKAMNDSSPKPTVSGLGAGSACRSNAED